MIQKNIFSVSVTESENATSVPYMLPAYIRTTSMVVCIMVMVLGIVGNLMVRFFKFQNDQLFCIIQIYWCVLFKKLL